MKRWSSRRITTWTALLSACLLLPAAASATPATYAGLVDQFSLSGNVPGSYVDDFSGTSTTPWLIDRGTATESGGFLHLTSPGTLDLSAQPAQPIAVEESQVLLLSPQATDGHGNFVESATWAQAVPGNDQQFATSLTYLTGTQQETVIVGIFNVGVDLGPALGAPAALYLYAETIDQPIGGSTLPGTATVAVSSALPIPASAVTGEIVMQLAYDDTAKTFTPSFSLDGGTNFLNVFPAITSTMTGSVVAWSVVASQFQVVPEPGTDALLLAGLLGLLVAGRRRT